MAIAGQIAVGPAGLDSTRRRRRGGAAGAAAAVPVTSPLYGHLRPSGQQKSAQLSVSELRQDASTRQHAPSSASEQRLRAASPTRVARVSETRRPGIRRSFFMKLVQAHFLPPFRIHLLILLRLGAPKAPHLPTTRSPPLFPHRVRPIVQRLRRRHLPLTAAGRLVVIRHRVSFGRRKLPPRRPDRAPSPLSHRRHCHDAGAHPGGQSSGAESALRRVWCKAEGGPRDEPPLPYRDTP